MKKNNSKKEKGDWGKKGFEQGQGQGGSESGFEGRQENQKNRGYEEDQPRNPVRSGKIAPKEQEGRSDSQKTYDDNI